MSTTQQRVFMAVHAHPDDECLGTGGVPTSNTGAGVTVPGVLSSGTITDTANGIVSPAQVFGETSSTVQNLNLLSGEVMEDPASVSVLRGLGARAELGTHLHGDFVPPQRRLHRGNMDGRAADAVQFEYPREVEEAKLDEWSREPADARRSNDRTRRSSPGIHSCLSDTRSSSRLNPGTSHRLRALPSDFPAPEQSAHQHHR